MEFSTLLPFKKSDLKPIINSENLGNALCATGAAICNYNGVITIVEFSLLASFSSSISSTMESDSIATFLTFHHLEAKTSLDKALSMLEKHSAELPHAERAAIYEALDVLLETQHKDKTKLESKIRTALRTALSLKESETIDNETLSTKFISALSSFNRQTLTVEEFASIYNQQELEDALKSGDQKRIKQSLIISKRAVTAELNNFIELDDSEKKKSLHLALSLIDLLTEQMKTRLEVIKNRIDQEKKHTQKHIELFVEATIDKILLELHQEMDFTAWEENNFWNEIGEKKAEETVIRRSEQLRSILTDYIQKWNYELGKFDEEVNTLSKNLLSTVKDMQAGQLISSLPITIRTKILIDDAASFSILAGKVSLGAAAALAFFGQGAIAIALIHNPIGATLAGVVATSIIWKIKTDRNKWKRDHLSYVTKKLEDKVIKIFKTVVDEHEKKLNEVWDKFNNIINQSLAPLTLERQLLLEIDNIKNRMVPVLIRKSIKSIEDMKG